MAGKKIEIKIKNKNNFSIEFLFLKYQIHNSNFVKGIDCKGVYRGKLWSLNEINGDNYPWCHCIEEELDYSQLIIGHNGRPGRIDKYVW